MILKTRWQRLAFVLSLIWILGAGLWERQRQVDFAEYHSGRMSDLCYKPNQKPLLLLECLTEERSRLDAELDTPIWFNIIFIAFAPLIGIWILGAIALATFRWVRKGS
jgi:hypothetical protein